jgi:ATP-dependent Clp protease adaptor protein ClpS
MSQQPLDRSARTSGGPRPGPLPPYKVILLRDAAKELMFIVRTVMELTRFHRAEATHKMWEAHHSGRSMLLVTHKERAELYVDQFADRGLPVTIEPV